ncbi:hypothetical protein HYH03_005180 [Edaphochlamys debaryana]|uniref:Glycosyltransferase family 92 protein n=1 Tax=Edaphochlamys debaryana TaxID=47281 RepID=A0A835Y5L0_9CHLO|nr:hypothetical protein HYH03_005180 [Edaphochlamys debaryana]|eukprot:KAG2496772.1 hypothetical protein HYH03_005180 [Edaphochlamys debaryana]
MQWHTQLGVCRFYIGYQGSDNATLSLLQQLDSVRLVLFRGPFAEVETRKRWLALRASHHYAKKHGNWILMLLQSFTGDESFTLARQEGFHWLAHIDCDELIMPSTTLRGDLRRVPPWVAWLKMRNYEAVVESVDVTNKFEEVTLFKSPRGPKGLQWRFRLGSHKDLGWHHFHLYNNGKAIGRADRGPIRMWGPHDFKAASNASWAHPHHNPEGKEVHQEAPLIVLHMPYTNWHELVSKAKVAKLTCPPEVFEAAKDRNHTAVESCILLSFDRHAFMAAVRGEEVARQFWVGNCLMSEGSSRGDGKNCRVFRDVARLKELLVQDGLFVRALAPQQTLRAHELAIRSLARSMGIRVSTPRGEEAAPAIATAPSSQAAGTKAATAETVSGKGSMNDGARREQAASSSGSGSAAAGTEAGSRLAVTSEEQDAKWEAAVRAAERGQPDMPPAPPRKH